MRWSCVWLLVLVACAKAGPFSGNPQDVIDANNSLGGNNGDAGDPFHHDANAAMVDATPDAKEIDARPIDAPPGVQTITLSQTATSTLLANNAIACEFTVDPGTDAATYSRVFDLGSAGVVGPLTLSSISFQVEDCESENDNGATVGVSVGTYTGTVGDTIDPTKISIIATNTNVAVPEVDEGSNSTPGATVTAPLAATIPAKSLMIVEVNAPDGDDVFQFFMGTNASGQSGDSYFAAPNCKPPGATPTGHGNGREARGRLPAHGDRYVHAVIPARA